MPTRLTLHFRQTTTENITSPEARVSRWTERHYLGNDDIAGANAVVLSAGGPAGGTGILDFRAALLGGSAQIVKYTLQKFTITAGQGEVPSGPPKEFRVLKSGPDGQGCDFPQQGVLVSYRLSDGNPQTARWILRGIPDIQIKGGEMAFTDAFRLAMKSYLDHLATRYGTIVDDRISAGGVGVPLIGVDVDGTATGFAAITIVGADDIAKVVGTRNSDGRRTGGPYLVSAVDGLLGTIRMDAWDRGPTTGGRLRKWARVYASYRRGTGQAVIQATRKVGSPRDYKATNRRSR